MMFVPVLFKEGSATGARVTLDDVAGAGLLGPSERIAADTGTLWTEGNWREQASADAKRWAKGPVVAAGIAASTQTLHRGVESRASIAEVSLALPTGGLLELRGVEAWASGDCDAVSGGAVVASAALAGVPLVDPLAPVEPNTVIALPGGAEMTLNAQGPHGTHGLQADAVQLTLPGVGEVTLASAVAALKNCGPRWTP